MALDESQLAEPIIHVFQLLILTFQSYPMVSNEWGWASAALGQIAVSQSRTIVTFCPEIVFSTTVGENYGC